MYGVISKKLMKGGLSMAKMKQGIMLLLALLIALSNTTIIAFAAQNDDAGIMPLYDYTHNASSSLGISNGKATAVVYCRGYNGTTKKITAETCIQKKFGLIWIKVDIGTSDDCWHDTTTNYYLSTSHSVSLSDSGTYRAKTKYVVTGTDGGSETITVHSSEVKY